MTEDLHTAEGISRRDMLKRSAIVGGASAMVWAAPSLTTFAPRAFGAQGSPPSGFSNFGAVIYCGEDSTAYRIKGEHVDGQPADTFEWEANPGNLGGCEVPFAEVWCAADSTKTGAELKVEFVTSGRNYLLVAPEGCFFQDGSASALKEGNCCYPGQLVTLSDGRSALKWYGPFESQPTCVDGAGKAGYTSGTPTKC